METIQATITLTLTKEQLLSLLGTAPVAPAAPAAVSTTAQTAAPAPLPSAPVQPSSTAPAPSPMTVPSAQPMPAQMPAAQPKTYSTQELGLAARPLVEQGRQQELLALLAEYGVPSIASLPEPSRADFAARLRAMGGQI